TAEFIAQRFRREIRDVPHHARDAHAGVGRASGAVVVAVLPVGIGGDRVSRDRIPGHALRLQRMRAGDKMIAFTSSPYCTAHSSACIPPSEPPAIAASCVMPSAFNSTRS